MNREEKIKVKYGTEGGWKVPDGYFESVFKEIEAKLPEYPVAEKTPDMTVWQRIKPYVYLAAMFAGIWCMMKVFHNVSGETRLSLENPPAQIAQAMVDPDVQDLLFIEPKTLTDYEIESEVSSSYDTMEEFERDFGYSLDPKFQQMSYEDNDLDEMDQ